MPKAYFCDGYTYFVEHQLTLDKWKAFRRASGNPAVFPVSSADLPYRDTKAEAQKDLDEYAARKRYRCIDLN